MSSQPKRQGGGPGDQFGQTLTPWEILVGLVLACAALLIPLIMFVVLAPLYFLKEQLIRVVTLRSKVWNWIRVQR
jgi:hypothetical protein